jgi:glutamate synthase (NADPH/NADH) large chain
VLKVMSKMGISTVASYRGAQVFEAVGLSKELIDEYFTGVASKLGGIGLDEIAAEVAVRHARAYPRERQPARAPRSRSAASTSGARGRAAPVRPGDRLPAPALHPHRRYDIFKQYTARVERAVRAADDAARPVRQGRPRPRPIPIDEVEPVERDRQALRTGAMSYGSISPEAHETLAIAMNRIGGKSNTGEGGEDPERYHDPRTATRRSRSSRSPRAASA